MSNSGTGTFLKSGSNPSVWIGVSGLGTDSGIANTGTKVSAAGVITQYNGYPMQGNGVPGEVFSTALVNQAANYNGGSPVTIADLNAAGPVRVSWNQTTTQAATSSSTFPSLTIGWTDPGGLARTDQIVATSTGNSTNVGSQGVFVLFTKASTPVTITSAGYASSGATPMQYSLTVVAEVL